MQKNSFNVTLAWKQILNGMRGLMFLHQEKYVAKGDCSSVMWSHFFVLSIYPSLLENSRQNKERKRMVPKPINSIWMRPVIFHSQRNGEGPILQHV